MTDKPDNQTSACRTQQLTIELDGICVSLMVECADLYHAIALYEEMLAGARQGLVSLNVGTVVKA